MTDNSTHIAGMRVLVAEDEFLVAMLLEEMLSDLGCVVFGPHGTLTAALSSARQDSYDVAIVDMNLSGEKADPLIGELQQRNIPIAIASGGYNAKSDFEPAVLLDKPYSLKQLQDALNTLHITLQLQNSGRA